MKWDGLAISIYHAAIIQLRADEGIVKPQKRFAIITPGLRGEMVQEEVESTMTSRF